MNMLRLVVTSGLGMLVSGCLQIERVISVAPDGSGALQETVMLSGEALTLARMFQPAEPAEGAKGDGERAWFSQQHLKAKAGAMGEGVSLVSVEPRSNGPWEGYIAKYAFTRVAALTVDQNPSSATPGFIGAGEEERREKVTFRFEPGTPSKVTVVFPETRQAPQSVPDEAPAEPDPVKEAASVAAMLRDMKVTLLLEVEGAVVESNAAYQEGSRVSLVKIDFNDLLKSPTKLKELSELEPESLQAAKPLLAGVPGAQIEMKPEVFVTFQ